MQLRSPNFDRLRIEKYQSIITHCDDRREAGLAVNASVIVVAFNPEKALFEANLSSLRRQAESHYEILVVDNSNDTDLAQLASRYQATYVKLSKNHGPQVGRNVGTMLAWGELCVFLDDDAIPDSRFIESHVIAHQEPEVLAVRGKCLPRTKNELNLLAFHYDLGENIIPSFIDLEGNSSFKRKELIQVGGFEESLPIQGGYEGTDVSLRLIRLSGNPDSIIYSPAPVIRHDYAPNPIKLIKKGMRHNSCQRDIRALYPEYGRLQSYYANFARFDTRNLVVRLLRERALVAGVVFLLSVLASQHYRI